MNVAPQAVFQTLKEMCAGQKVVENGGSVDTSTTSQMANNIPSAPAETRG